MASNTATVSENCIREGSCVIMRKLNGSRLTQCRVKRNLNVLVENLKFRLDATLIGKTYGVYNVKNGILMDKATESEIADYRSMCESSAEPEEIESSTTRGNQKNLVREKIQLKHARRALTLVQIERTNPRLLAELFYARNPDSVGFLRTDHISYMMEISGILEGSRVLIFDQCSGVVTSHVLERLNGRGHCVLLHNGRTVDNIIQCVQNCQFSKKVAGTLRTLPVKCLLELEKCEEANSNEVEDEDKKIKDMVASDDIALKDANKKFESDLKLESEAEALSWFKTDRFAADFGCYDSLLIICRNADPCSVLEKTLKAVRTSGTVVVYSPDSSVVSAAYAFLEERACVFIQIRSSQCREIQVLKHRTHPLMQHLIPGGYVLNAVRCYNPS